MYELLKFLGASAAGMAALAWLAQSIYRHWLDKDVERFKSELHHEHEFQMEKLRSDLRIRSIEHEIRFRGIHEGQAQVIANTYAKLQRLHEVIVRYARFIEFGGEPSKEEQLKTADDANRQFREYFNARRLFLPEETAKMASDLANKLVSLANVYGRLQRRVPDASWEELNEKFASIEKEVPTLPQHLESEFRKLLAMDLVAGNASGTADALSESM